MLNQLEDIASALGMTFGYGTIDALEALAKEHANEGYLLFHEGYLTADLNQDGQGALEYRHRLIIDILTRSLPTDKPQERRGYLLGLEIEMRRVYKYLSKLGQVSNARAEMGLNLTSTNLDAIRLTLTLLPDAVSLCRS